MPFMLVYENLEGFYSVYYFFLWISFAVKGIQVHNTHTHTYTSVWKSVHEEIFFQYNSTLHYSMYLKICTYVYSYVYMLLLRT